MMSKFSLILLVFLPVIAQASTITVGPGEHDYTGIQAAIDAASPGDVIEIHEGRYRENVDVNKPLTLIGVGQPVVDAGGSESAITLSADGITLEGFEATNAESDGIRITSNDNIVSKNLARKNGDYGIELNNSDNNTLRGNCGIGNFNGIYLGYSDRNDVVGNRAICNEMVGIFLTGSCNNTISENIASQNGGRGIHLQESLHNAVVRNELNDNNWSSIRVVESHYNSIIDNSATHNDDGVCLRQSNNNEIINNNLVYNRWSGISLDIFCDNNTISGNNISYNNLAGLIASLSENNTISRNMICHNNKRGIELAFCTNNVIYENRFAENSQEENNPSGQRNFEILGFLTDALFAYLYGDVEGNVRDFDFNQWDNGNVGNYYDDFDCVDEDGDGICDSAYEIPNGSSVDRYPLVEM